MSVLSILSGSLAIDHVPATDQSVLVIDSKADIILYSGTTDSSGNFSWNYPAQLEGSKVYVLAKYRTGSVLTSEYRELILSGQAKCSFDINSNELETLSFEFKGEQGPPNFFYLHIDPLNVSGVPENLLPFLSKQGNNIGGAYYYHTFDVPVFTMKVKRGSYRMNSMYFVASSTGSQTKPSENLITSNVICDGKPLEGNNLTGFKIEIESSASLIFMMVPVK